ncbi:MAG: ACT domain-containing protein [Magnetococcus sp. MYC-9]
MNPHALLTVSGRDRPGIVARTTQVLFEAGCNIADSSMTRLGCEFTVMLIVQLPSALTCAALTERFGPLAAEMALTIQAQPVPTECVEVAPTTAPAQSATLCVMGADQPGIVFKTTQLLAEMGCNIIDLYTHRSGTAKRPVYSMVIDVELPDLPEFLPQLQPRLAELEKQLEVEITLRLADASLM